jgi:hypothetical protein
MQFVLIAMFRYRERRVKLCFPSRESYRLLYSSSLPDFNRPILQFLSVFISEARSWHCFLQYATFKQHYRYVPAGWRARSVASWRKRVAVPSRADVATSTRTLETNESDVTYVMLLAGGLSLCDLACRNALFNLTNWQMPRSLALLEKPPVMQLLKNFLTFYGIRRFGTKFTKSSRLLPTLSQKDPVRSTLSYLSKSFLNVIHPSTSWSS